MIMAIATNIDPDTVKNWVYATFGKMEKNSSDYPPLPQIIWRWIRNRSIFTWEVYARV
jgi:hypothetical protein